MNNRFNLHFYLCIICICASLTGGRALAQDQDSLPDEYRIEIILLRNLNPVSGTEIWPAPDVDQDDLVPAQRFTPLESAELELGEMVRRLSNSRNFRPVSHFGWIQPGFPQEDANRKVILRNATTGESVQGHFVLSKERYLRLEMELTIDFDDQTHYLSTARRLLSRQVHYFDHPYFGVIAKVTPIQGTLD